MRTDIVCWDSSVMISHIGGDESTYAERAQKTQAVNARVFHTFDEQLLAMSKQDEVDGLEITACEIPGLPPRLF